MGSVYKITEDEFVSQVKDRFGDRFSLPDLDFRGLHKKVKVICPKHGEIWMLPYSLLNNSLGCTKCSRGATSIQNCGKGVPNTAVHISREEAESRFQVPEGYILDFSKYRCWTDGDVSIKCPKHGTQTWTSAWRAMQARNFCTKCGAQKNADSRALSWDEFLMRAEKAFGSLFSYADEYNYRTIRSHVSVVCKIHGKQKIRAIAHLEGQYCSQCRRIDDAQNGVRPGLYAEILPHDPELAAQPGRIYYFRHGDKYKVGITKTTMKQRLKGVPDSQTRVSELETVEMTLGEALAIEQEILKRFDSSRITRDWTTELFDHNVLEPFGGLAGYIATRDERESHGEE